MPAAAVSTDASFPLPSRPSQPARVLDAFVAPTRAFRDLQHSASWWLPCLVILVMSSLFSWTVLHKVGVRRLSDNLLATMPRMQEMIANAKPDQAALIRAKFDNQITSQFYTTPLITLAAAFAVSGLFLLSTNFLFGARATYGRMLAMYWYSLLPLAALSLLVIALLWAGVNVESFRVNNPVGTNPGYYMPEGTSPVAVALLSFLDLFSVWVFCLQAIGASIVARISLGKAIVAVGIWWVLYLVLKIVPVMLFS